MSDRDAFTPLEEAFFRAGAAIEAEQQPAEDFADLEEGGARRRPLLQRLFSRKSSPQ
jgi:hypothetical protein